MEKFAVHLHLPSSSRRNRDRTFISSAMFSNESNSTYTGRAVFVIILVFSLLSKPAIGRPLLGSPEEESPNFQSIDNPDRPSNIMEGYDTFHSYNNTLQLSVMFIMYV